MIFIIGFFVCVFFFQLIFEGVETAVKNNKPPEPSMWYPVDDYEIPQNILTPAEIKEIRQEVTRSNMRLLKGGK